MFNQNEQDNGTQKAYTYSKTIDTHYKDPNRSGLTEDLKKGLKGKAKGKEQISPRKKPVTTDPSKTGSLTYGERLYYKQIALKEISKKKAKDKENILKKEQSAKIKFTPETNPNNKAKSKFNNIPSLEDINNKPKGLTSAELKEMNDLIEIQNYKNKNKISITEEEINNLTEKLHNELKVNEHKKNELTKKTMDEICPFTPKTNENIKNPTYKNFFFRLQNWIDNLHIKNEIKWSSPPIDEKTGQVLFTPNIGSKGPKREDAFDFLYKEGDVLKNKREKEINDYYSQCKNLSNSVKMSTKSEKLSDNNKKAEGINALFKCFDIDNSGVIKYSKELEKKINKNFSEDFAYFFKNIIYSLKNNDMQLNKDEFCDMINNLHLTMTEGVRKEILECGNK